MRNCFPRLKMDALEARLTKLTEQVAALQGVVVARTDSQSAAYHVRHGKRDPVSASRIPLSRLLVTLLNPPSPPPPHVWPKVSTHSTLTSGAWRWLLASGECASSKREWPRPPRRRVFNITAEPGIHVLWRQNFHAFVGEAPGAIRGARRLCNKLSSSQWPYCSPAPCQSCARTQNTLQLVAMACAYTDGGRNYKGALFDEHRILNAQHESATPAFRRGPLTEYEVAAVALTPYGHLTDSHFFASTAPWVLTMLHLLPDEIPILVSLSARLRQLYSRLGVPAERLHALPSKGTVFAKLLLSFVTLPFRALEPLGSTALNRVRSRLMPLPLPTSSRDRIILLSRCASPQQILPSRSYRYSPPDPTTSFTVDPTTSFTMDPTTAPMVPHRSGSVFSTSPCHPHKQHPVHHLPQGRFGETALAAK